METNIRRLSCGSRKRGCKYTCFIYSTLVSLMIRDDDSTSEKLKQIESSLLAFDAGGRACPEKHVSLTKMWNMMPQSVRAYEIRLTGQNRKWMIRIDSMCIQCRTCCLSRLIGGAVL